MTLLLDILQAIPTLAVFSFGISGSSPAMSLGQHRKTTPSVGVRAVSCARNPQGSYVTENQMSPKEECYSLRVGEQMLLELLGQEELGSSPGATTHAAGFPGAPGRSSISSQLPEDHGPPWLTQKVTVISCVVPGTHPSLYFPIN